MIFVEEGTLGEKIGIAGNIFFIFISFSGTSEYVSKNMLRTSLCTRDRPKFFDQVGHQTTNVSIGNKLFFAR